MHVDASFLPDNLIIRIAPKRTGMFHITLLFIEYILTYLMIHDSLLYMYILRSILINYRSRIAFFSLRETARLHSVPYTLLCTSDRIERVLSARSSDEFFVLLSSAYIYEYACRNNEPRRTVAAKTLGQFYEWISELIVWKLKWEWYAK